MLWFRPMEQCGRGLISFELANENTAEVWIEVDAVGN
jgi:hypothetical protein